MYLTTLDRDFDRLVRRTFGTNLTSTVGTNLASTAGMGSPTGNFAGTALPMDTVRREGEVVLRFDVPGVDPEKIDVTVDRGVLTIGATREETKTEGDQSVVRERFSGSVTRRVRLSDNLDAEKIEASNSNGVLTIRIPVREEAKPRKIEVGTVRELAS